MNTENIIKSLKNGQIVCFPTETLYALAVDAYNATAIHNMYLTKKRPSNKPCAIMLEDVSMATDYAVVNSQQLSLMKKFLPGPVTFLLQKKSDCSLVVGEKIGIRIPENDHALKILRDFKGPLLSTSANIADDENATCFAEISQKLLAEIDSYIKDDQGISGIGSTIIDITTEPFTIIRPGSLEFTVN